MNVTQFCVSCKNSRELLLKTPKTKEQTKKEKKPNPEPKTQNPKPTIFYTNLLTVSLLEAETMEGFSFAMLHMPPMFEFFFFTTSMYYFCKQKNQ